MSYDSPTYLFLDWLKYLVSLRECVRFYVEPVFYDQVGYPPASSVNYWDLTEFEEDSTSLPLLTFCPVPAVP